MTKTPGAMRLAKGVLRLVCFFLPHEGRAERYTEWTAELFWILDDAEFSRGRRILHGMAYSIDQGRTVASLRLSTEAKKRLIALLAASVAVTATTSYSLHAVQAAKNNRISAELSALAAQETDLENRLHDTKRQLTQLTQKYYCELTGTGCRDASGHPGFGVEARKLQAARAMTSTRVKDIEAQLTGVRRQIRDLKA
ncbi:hypothetical protein ACFYTC_06900 [Actinomadura nitritigenes]|uniref:hypothetical protein n=1 Tax=Actinomadura nitritigenes TaxID=134602 RepID=UPI003681A86B